MKGLKWRAYSPATSKIAELVGAQPVTVQAAEVSQALATGVVDSMILRCDRLRLARARSTSRTTTTRRRGCPRTRSSSTARRSTRSTSRRRTALLKAAAEAETRGWKVSQEKNGWYLDQLKQNGMTIMPPSEQLTADLRKVGNDMLAEWQRKAGADGRKVVDAYRK